MGGGGICCNNSYGSYEGDLICWHTTTTTFSTLDNAEMSTGEKVLPKGGIDNDFLLLAT